MHTLINNITLNDLIKSYLGVLRGLGHYTVASTSGLYPAKCRSIFHVFFPNSTGCEFVLWHPIRSEGITKLSVGHGLIEE